MTTHVAAAQSLGFVYQFDRAVFRLLNSNISVVEVGIEDIDDVSEHLIDGTIIREQDKTSVNQKSPLTDKSEALWKTLKIWCNAVRNDIQILNYTCFHLVTNGTVRPNSLVHHIHHVSDTNHSITLAQSIKQIATGLREDLAQHANDILALDDDLLAKLLVNIEVFDNVSPTFGGDINEILALRFYDEPLKTAIFDQARGWVLRRIIDAVYNKEQPKIKRKDFDLELTAIFKRAHLTPYTMMIEPVDPNLNVNKFLENGFVQQLHWINYDMSKIKRSIIHYVQAGITRQKWANGIISEDELIQYQDDLIEKWSYLRDMVDFDPSLNEEKKGQLLLNKAVMQTTYINSQPMPTAFTSGCYHGLADFTNESLPRIGWHPDYEEKVKNLGGNSS